MILLGPLIVNGYTVPFTEVQGKEGEYSIMLRRAMCWSVKEEDFEHIAELVANAVAVGLGLPCHPREAIVDDRFQAQIDRLHVVLRPVRAMCVGEISTEPDEDKPRLELVKQPKEQR